MANVSHVENHNLQFSTNIDPRKSKTKCIAFLKKERKLNNIKLNGNNLPFVTSAKHLGNTIENDKDFTANDIKIKRARYIQRNNEINQEFHFVNYSIKCLLNNIDLTRSREIYYDHCSTTTGTVCEYGAACRGCPLCTQDSNCGAMDRLDCVLNCKAMLEVLQQLL